MHYYVASCGLLPTNAPRGWGWSTRIEARSSYRDENLPRHRSLFGSLAESLLIAASRSKAPQSLAASQSAVAKYENVFPHRASEMVACNFMLENAQL